MNNISFTINLLLFGILLGSLYSKWFVESLYVYVRAIFRFTLDDEFMDKRKSLAICLKAHSWNHRCSALSTRSHIIDMLMEVIKFKYQMWISCPTISHIPLICSHLHILSAYISFWNISTVHRTYFNSNGIKWKRLYI